MEGVPNSPYNSSTGLKIRSVHWFSRLSAGQGKLLRVFLVWRSAFIQDENIKTCGLSDHLSEWNSKKKKKTHQSMHTQHASIHITTELLPICIYLWAWAYSHSGCTKEQKVRFHDFRAILLDLQKLFQVGKQTRSKKGIMWYRFSCCPFKFGES